MGSKAQALERLARAGFRVPPFFVVGPLDETPADLLAQRSLALAPALPDPRFAVRSSAVAEDGATASFAGMFESYLFVAPGDVAERIARVRRSGTAARVAAYAAGTQRNGGMGDPAAIVQLMVDADVSGVAFGRDPIDGSDRVVIACTYGMGPGVVGGDADTDTFWVDAAGTIERKIALKTIAHRRAATLAGTAATSVGATQAELPAIDDFLLREIDATVRAIGAYFGTPQDVEWSITGRTLFILQARPVTTPPGIIWDNSNIAESYGGIVSPLTFSFAQHAYAGAYRQFMRVLALPPSTIAAHDDELRNMLGLIDGRMYYHLLNWYRLLALIPGFRLNRNFMETMMGVGEALPAPTVASIERTGRTRDALAVVATLAALVRTHLTLDGAIVRFHERIAAVLAPPPTFETSTLSELAAEFTRLEDCLLTAWEAPLANDFFAMVWYGLLRRLTANWCADDDGSIQNDLLCAEGGMISAQPAQRVAALALVCSGDGALLRALESGSESERAAALARRPDVAAAIADYVRLFGDRCQSELKLETRTLHEDPRPLLRAIARLAVDRGPTSALGNDGPDVSPARTGPGDVAARDAVHVRAAAQRRVAAALRRNPLRRGIVALTVAQARKRIRDRENLRYERTRVFGRVRRIFAAIGVQFAAQGRIADARDIFYLELAEIWHAIDDATFDLAKLVCERQARYAMHAAAPAPPARVNAIGVHAPAAQRAREVDLATTRRGIGCCPGVVRARVRIVRDPQSRFERGEILVAERTDPGWIMIFPAAAGILVERGSVLSHAAIVSRELGIPSVVAVAGLTCWLRDGDLVEFDGRTGRVTRIDDAAPLSDDCSPEGRLSKA
jgi:phosphohistidine swiveling domain-containing protein